MGGQRSYYGNVLTNVREAILCAGRYQLNGAAQPTRFRGPVTCTHTAATNRFIWTFPEQYWVPVNIDAVYSVSQQSSAGCYARIGNYDPQTSTLIIDIGATDIVAIDHPFIPFNDPFGLLDVWILAQSRIGGR